MKDSNSTMLEGMVKLRAELDTCISHMKDAIAEYEELKKRIGEQEKITPSDMFVETCSRVLRIIHDVTGEEVQPDTNIADDSYYHYADSLDLLTLYYSIKDEFGIELDFNSYSQHIKQEGLTARDLTRMILREYDKR